jgi:uncharacterized protein (TIGR02444 family)
MSVHPETTDSPLWRFAVAAWRHPGCAARLVRLQDEHGVEVLPVLAALYQGACGQIPTQAAAAEVLARHHPFASAVIAPLRAARRALARTGHEGDLRRQTQRLELAAEAIAMARLAAALQQTTLEPGTAEAAVERMLIASGMQPGPAAAHASAICAECMPGD